MDGGRTTLGAGVARLQIDLITGQWRKAAEDAKLTQLQLADAVKGTIADVKNAWSDNTKAIEDTWKSADPRKPAKTDFEGLGSIVQNANKKSIDALIELNIQKLSAEEKYQAAALDVIIAGSKAELANGQITAKQQIAIEQAANQKRYQLEVDLVNAKIREWQRDPTKSKEKAQELGDELLALEAAHNKKLLDEQVKLVAEMNKLAGKPIVERHNVPLVASRAHRVVKKV